MPGNDTDSVETHLLPCPDCQENAATIIAQSTMAYPNYRQNFPSGSAFHPEDIISQTEPFGAHRPKVNSRD